MPAYSAPDYKSKAVTKFLQNRPKHCRYCDSEFNLKSTPFIACSGCRYYLYCCFEHQHLDSACHKQLCEASAAALKQYDEECSLGEQSTTAGSVMTMYSNILEIIRKYGTYTMKKHSENRIFVQTVDGYAKSLADGGFDNQRNKVVELRLKYITKHVVDSLNNYGWALIDNFLGDYGSSGALSEMKDLYESGAFSVGRIAGYQSGGVVDQRQRSDQVFSFDKNTERTRECANLHSIVHVLDKITLSFGPDFPYKISARTNPVLSVYHENRARYVKHVDNPVGDGRCLTCIYYCNANWDVEKDGGYLTLYPESSETALTVPPINDRLIFFWSDRRNPHEVMPAYRDRFAMTIWYMDYEQRAEKCIRENERKEWEEEQDRKKMESSTQIVELCS